MSEIQTIRHLKDITLDADMREMLVRLPYRIGFWLSQSDQGGGAQADEIELQAMESLILSYGEDVCKSEFTQSVMEETVNRYESWDQWRGNIENLPKECAAVTYHLGMEVNPKQLNDFKDSLFEIAETVALAYRELDEKDDLLNKIYINVRILQKKWHAMVKRYDFSLDHALNISVSEERALGELKGALRL